MKTSWRKSIKKTSLQIFLCSCAFILAFTDRNLKCTFLVVKWIMHALIYLCLHRPLLYHLPHGKEIILSSHVFSKCQKRETKVAWRMYFKKSENTFLCRCEGDIYAPWKELYFPVSEESCLLLCSLLLLSIFAGFYVFCPYCRLYLRFTKLPINFQKLFSWWENLLEIEKC